MNLWLSTHFLLAALFLSSSALTPKECQPLVKPLSLADSSMMNGRWTILMGYTDHEVHSTILKKIDSCWLNVTGMSDSAKGAIDSYDKINGVCLESTGILTVDGIQGSLSYVNMSSTFHVLPSCDGCLVYSVNSTVNNPDKLNQLLNIQTNIHLETLNFSSVFLMGRNSTLNKSDLEHFEQQASCLGFSKEPDFRYDPKHDFCAEGEGIKVSF